MRNIFFEGPGSLSVNPLPRKVCSCNTPGCTGCGTFPVQIWDGVPGVSKPVGDLTTLFTDITSLGDAVSAGDVTNILGDAASAASAGLGVYQNVNSILGGTPPASNSTTPNGTTKSQPSGQPQTTSTASTSSSNSMLLIGIAAIAALLAFK